MKKKNNSLRSIVKKTPYRKPAKPQPVKELFCYVCKQKATHVLLIELREKPGPPLKSEVIYTVCEKHISTDFDRWVPILAFKKLCLDLQKEVGIVLNKQYCTIKALPLKIK